MILRRTAAMPAILVALATFLAGTDAGAAATRIKPTAHAGSVKIKVGPRSSGYHRATRAKPVEFYVRGPMQVRVLSRYLYPKGRTARTTTYGLRVEIDGVTLRDFVEKTIPSSRASAKSGPVGALERTLVRIPAGDHKVHLRPIEEDEAVAVRLFVGAGRESASRLVAYAPEKHAGAIRMHTRDAELTYYRITAAQPASMTVRGPMRMKVTSRLDFGTTNGYTQAYVIRVLLDGKAWKAFPHKARASHTVAYPEFPEVTPGIARDFMIDVPPGVHTVEIAVGGTTAGAAAVRIQVPEKDLRAGR